MNQETYNLNCPHCGNELSVESSMVGMQVSCPICNREFVVPAKNNAPKKSSLKLHLPGVSTQATAPSQASAASETSGSKQQSFSNNNTSADNNTPSNGEYIKYSFKGYPWGRLYILLCWIAAIIWVLGGLGYAAILLYEPFKIRHERFETLKEKEIPALVEQQKAFQNNYLSTVNLISMGRNEKAKIKLSPDLTLQPGTFNDTLLTPEDANESLETLQLYNVKIEKLSKELTQHFAAQYKKIEKVLKRGKALNYGWNKKGNQQKSSALHMTFGQDVDFYMDKNGNVPKEIKELNKGLNSLEDETKKAKELKFKQELEKIRAGIEFVEKVLNEKKHEISVGRDRSTGTGDRKQTVHVGKEQYKKAREILENIIIRLNRLTSSEHKEYYRWKIVIEAEGIETALNKHIETLEEIDKEFKDLLKKNSLYAFIIFMCVLWIAFLIMVFADFLRAHFDSAMALRSIDSKFKLILLLPLFSFLIGCGPDPEEVLKNSITELQNAAINSLFAEKIMQNPDATTYIVPNSEFIQITGGERHSSLQYNKYIYHSAAYYNVVRIICTATTAYSGLKEYKKKPFTHKALLLVNFQIKMYETDMEKNSNGTPGLEFHTLPPEQGFSEVSKEKWLEIRSNEVPESQYNHAVAIHRISQYQPSNYTESRSFEIFYNPKTEQWEFGNAIKQLTTTISPPSYSEKQHEMIMKGYKRKKFTARNTETKEPVILWVRAEDYDTLDKVLNQDLMKVNGVWKKRIVVEHTEELQKAINEWNKKDMVSLEDLEQILLKPIQKCTDAENREDAIALAKKKMIKIFLRKPEEAPTERDQRRLRDTINFIKNTPSVRLLNREELLKIAQQTQDYMDAYAREQAKKDAERREEEARRREEEARRGKEEARRRAIEEERRRKERVRRRTELLLPRMERDIQLVNWVSRRNLPFGLPESENSVEPRIRGLVFFAKLKNNLKVAGGKVINYKTPQFALAGDYQAIQFNGNADQGILCSWKRISMSYPRTVSLWFFNKSSNRGGAMLSYGMKAKNRYFSIETGRSSGLYCGWGGAFSQYTSSNGKINNWNHVVIVYDGNYRFCYLNGRMRSRERLKLDTVPSDLMIGTRLHDTEHSFTGSIRNIAIYDRALTPTEIKLLNRYGMLD